MPVDSSPTRRSIGTEVTSGTPITSIGWYMAGRRRKVEEERIQRSDQDMHQKSIVLHGREHGDLRVIELDVFIVRHPARAQLFRTRHPADQAVDLRLVRRAVQAQVEQPHGRGRHSVAADVRGLRSRLARNAGQCLAAECRAWCDGRRCPLRWEGGWWAHKYDIYFGTTNPPTLIAQNYMPGSATAGVSRTRSRTIPAYPRRL